MILPGMPGMPGGGPPGAETEADCPWPGNTGGNYATITAIPRILRFDPWRHN